MAQLDIRGSLFVAGCYERFLFGLDSGPGEAAALKKAFTLEAHLSAVKCLAAAGGYLASGGTDDLIRLFDARRGLHDLGFLAHHEGSVSCLQFYPGGGSSPTHLLSGGADGELVIWSVGGRWDKLKALKAHRGGVSALAVHPSGRLALSCGADRGLRVWDLAKGRCTFKTKRAAPGEGLGFTADGGAYWTHGGSDAALVDLASGNTLCALPHAARVLCCAAQQSAGGRLCLLTGGEGRSLTAWDCRTAAAAVEVKEAHATRVRGVALPWQAAAGAGSEEQSDFLPALVCTAASDGTVKLWDLRRPDAPLSELDTRARVTCLLSMPLPEPAAGGAAGGGGGGGGGARRVAVDAVRPPPPPAAAARKGDGAWWEEGEKGPKLSAQLAERQQERAANERRMRGVNPKQLKEREAKAKRAKEEAKSFGREGGGRGRGGEEAEGGRGGGRGGRGGRGGGGQFAKRGEKGKGAGKR